MSLWRHVTRGLRALTRRAAADRDLADEVAHYLDEATAAHVARGLAPDEARRAARREMGDPSGVAEQVREYGWETLVENLLQDLRYAFRRLWAEPVFTAVAVATLGLGIGATTAVFGVVYPILLEPLPYPEPGRVVTVWYRADDGSRLYQAFGNYRELAERSRAVDALAAYREWQPIRTGTGEPERLDGQRVSAAYFHVLGVAPALGRGFEPSEDVANGRAVAILSDGLWRRRFGADSTIVGRPVVLDGQPFVVVGVMPRRFENVLAPDAELWAPLQYDLSQGRAWGHHLRVVGRMRPGVAAADAAREMDAVARNPVPEFTRPPHASAAHGFIVASLKDDVTRGIRPALLAVFGAVALVLVIACVNVTNLLLARGVRRRGELALRAALGAGRHRLVRQLLTESLLLASLGGIAGLAVAVVGVRALVPLVPAGLPRAAAIGVGGGAFGFALGLTTFVGLVFGLVPAFQGARSDPQESLVSAGRRSTGRHRRVRGALVVAEVAVAVVVLAGAGLLLRSIQRLFAVPPGFDPSSIVTMRVETAGPRLAADSATARFFAQALDAVRRVPGVASAALTSQLPLSGERDLYGLRFDGAVADDPGEAGGTLRYAVSPGYFETMRIPVRRGRRFDERDRAGAPLVAVISESVARRRLPGLDPLGRQVTVGSGAPYTVVGVVGDVRQALASSDADAVYVPAAQWRFADRAMSLVVRARGAPAELVPALRRAVWSADRGQAIERVATMNHLLTTSVADRRFALLLFEVFALVAVVLAAAGIYGVLATGVAERTREVGVRAALGATPSDIVGLVLREGMLLAGVGVLLGLAGAAAASRAVVSLLFGVSRVDPVTYGGVVAVLGTVALLAGAVPAWRAARVDPMEALRAE